MFNLFKKIFSTKKEHKKFDYKEELLFIKSCLEIHQEFDNGKYHGLDFYKEYVRKSKYVTDGIKEKTIELLNKITPLYFNVNANKDMTIAMMTKFFELEKISIDRSLNHLNKLKAIDNILDSEKEKFDSIEKELSSILDKMKDKMSLVEDTCKNKST